MHIFTRLLALARGYQLARQFAFIERCIQSLSVSDRTKLEVLIRSEISRAAQCEFPHLYGTPPEQRYPVWGQGSNIGFTWVRSENHEVRLRGIALWCAVVLHETRDALPANLQLQHRQVLRVLRELKLSSQRSGAAKRWMETRAA